MKMGFREAKLTKPERQMRQLLKDNDLNYQFVGNNRLQIGKLFPDFVHKSGRKKLIEVYGDYWHRGQNPQDRIDYFERFGWDCIVIWESEIGKDPAKVLEWILEFDAVN